MEFPALKPRAWPALKLQGKIPADAFLQWLFINYKHLQISHPSVPYTLMWFWVGLEAHEPISFKHSPTHPNRWWKYIRFTRQGTRLLCAAPASVDSTELTAIIVGSTNGWYSCNSSLWVPLLVLVKSSDSFPLHLWPHLASQSYTFWGPGCSSENFDLTFTCFCKSFTLYTHWSGRNWAALGSWLLWTQEGHGFVFSSSRKKADVWSVTENQYWSRGDRKVPPSWCWLASHRLMRK